MVDSPTLSHEYVMLVPEPEIDTTPVRLLLHETVLSLAVDGLIVTLKVPVSPTSL